MGKRKKPELREFLIDELQHTTAEATMDPKSGKWRADKVKRKGRDLHPNTVAARDKVRHHTKLHGPGHRKCRKCKRMVMRNSLFCWAHAGPLTKSLKNLIGTKVRRSRAKILKQRIRAAHREGWLPPDLPRTEIWRNVMAHAHLPVPHHPDSADQTPEQRMKFALRTKPIHMHRDRAALLGADMVVAFVDLVETGDGTAWAEGVQRAHAEGFAERPPSQEQWFIDNGFEGCRCGWRTGPKTAGGSPGGGQ